MTLPRSTQSAVDEPAPDPIPAKQRPLLWTLLLSQLAVGTFWGAASSIFLALQVQQISPDNKTSDLAVVIGIGAIGAMFAAPIVGALSDRTRSRLGARAPWILGGLVASLIGIAGLSVAQTVPMLAGVWLFTQIATNFVAQPIAAHIPDRVPAARRGVFSSFMGLGSLFGSLLGQTFGATFASAIPTGYAILGIALVVAIVVFVVVNDRHANTDDARPPAVSLRVLLSTFWVNPVRHPDFFWAFTGRFLLFVGYFAVSAYQLYILQDYIGLGKDAVQAVPLVGLVGLAGILISTAVAGPLSDKLGRRKLFVWIAATVLALSLLFPFFMPSLTGMLLYAGFSGLGFGAYQAVDYAIVTEVLPSKENYGKDLGLINITTTLPQTMASAVAGIAVAVFASYAALFPVAAVLVLLGAFAIMPIKSVR